MDKQALILVDRKKFVEQNGMIYTAIKEIDLDNPDSLELFFNRMGELGVIGVIKIGK